MTMSEQQLIDYYASLLILQYLGKPKAFATIQALVKPVIMSQLPLDVQNAFEIGTAVGAQLDILGKYVGVSRSGYGATGPITLDDDDYTSLIKIIIIKNNSGSSLGDIQGLLATYFPNQIFVSDNADMSLSYTVVETVGSSDLIDILVYNGLLPKPMGVAINVTVVPSITDYFFGFGTYSVPPFHVSPFNTYPIYNLNYPWITYDE